jgi:hypothetical protein
VALTTMASPAAVGAVGLALSLVTTAPLHAQHLDTAVVRIPLDSALTIARTSATAWFPELGDYLLYSVTPRVLLGDPGGFHWQVLWQSRTFPQHDWLVVRVYMSDGHASTGREPRPGTSE